MRVVVTEVQLRSKAVNVQTGILGHKSASLLHGEVHGLFQAHEAAAKRVHVGLQRVREVDQHQWALLQATADVQAARAYDLAPAALGEFVACCHHEQPVRLVNVSCDVERSSNLGNLTLAFVDGVLHGVRLCRTVQPCTPHSSLGCTKAMTNHGACSIELHRRNELVFVDNLTTTHAIPIFVNARGVAVATLQLRGRHRNQSPATCTEYSPYALARQGVPVLRLVGANDVALRRHQPTTPRLAAAPAQAMQFACHTTMDANKKRHNTRKQRQQQGTKSCTIRPCTLL